MAKACRPVSRSSFIRRVCYDRAGEELTLRFKKNDYQFSGVEPRVVDGLLKAPSMGKYYNSEIRGDYTARGKK